MKIIHTADWHLGKELHQNSLDEDHNLFLEWLLHYIIQNEIDVLLIAGDVFDHANPSNEARKRYYGFLTEMAKNKVQVIVIGGNHDSIQMLSASSQLLGLLNVHVVGGLENEQNKVILPLSDKNGIQAAWCIALPFLRDRDLRVYREGESPSERIEALRAGLVKIYAEYAEKAKQINTRGLPLIGMGHLYLQGASLSESERDVQLGNAAGIASNALGGLFDYLALGHIHKPQQFEKGTIRYSGSPISLSFSERKDQKYIVEVEVSSNGIECKNIEVPKFRQLIRWEGSWEEIRQKFEEWEKHDGLPDLFDLDITADMSRVPEIEAEIQQLRDKEFTIARRKISPATKDILLSEQVDQIAELKELEPREVFDKKMAGHNFTPEEKEMLTAVYREILEEVIQGELP